MNILVVDDAAFMRRMLTQILERGGHKVVGEASNGSEALEQYKALHPDMVTMDITMDGINGIEAVKQIRAYDPSALIIMCSAMGQQPMMLDAIQSGAKEFIIKPFRPSRVLEAVRKAGNMV